GNSGRLLNRCSARNGSFTGSKRKSAIKRSAVSHRAASTRGRFAIRAAGMVGSEADGVVAVVGAGLAETAAAAIPGKGAGAGTWPLIVTAAVPRGFVTVFKGAGAGPAVFT